MPAGEYTWQITPLGAAIVEALPDREAVRKIKRTFTRTGYCPPSALFDAAAVAAWKKRAKKGGGR